MLVTYCHEPQPYSQVLIFESFVLFDFYLAIEQTHQNTWAIQSFYIFLYVYPLSFFFVLDLSGSLYKAMINLQNLFSTGIIL